MSWKLNRRIMLGACMDEQRQYARGLLQMAGDLQELRRGRS